MLFIYKHLFNGGLENHTVVPWKDEPNFTALYDSVNLVTYVISLQSPNLCWARKRRHALLSSAKELGYNGRNAVVIPNGVNLDAFYQNLEISKKHMDVLSKLGISQKKYFLVTMHRAENVDVKEGLASVLDALQEDGGVLRSPCVTLRNNTERPEAIDVGTNVLAGVDKDKILACVKDGVKVLMSGRIPLEREILLRRW